VRAVNEAAIELVEHRTKWSPLVSAGSLLRSVAIAGLPATVVWTALFEAAGRTSGWLSHTARVLEMAPLSTWWSCVAGVGLIIYVDALACVLVAWRDGLQPSLPVIRPSMAADFWGEDTAGESAAVQARSMLAGPAGSWCAGVALLITHVVTGNALTGVLAVYAFYRVLPALGLVYGRPIVSIWSQTGAKAQSVPKASFRTRAWIMCTHVGLLMLSGVAIAYVLLA
jgi:hypothetical protein